MLVDQSQIYLFGSEVAPILIVGGHLLAQAILLANDFP